MKLVYNKTLSRLKTISLYGLSQIMGVFSVLLLSFIIIKYHSTELWGAYAELLIWSNFILLFLSFGNRDYLLKSFSQSPSTINQEWGSSIFVRSLLLIPGGIVLNFVPLFKNLEILIFILIVVLFVNQSFKVLILYHRHFKFNVYVELAFNLFLVILLFYRLEMLDLKNLLMIIISCQVFKLACYLAFYFKSFRYIKLQIRLKSLWQSIPFFIPLVLGTIRVKIDAYYGTYFFDAKELGKYQVFLNFLMLGQMVSTFVLNPFLKNFYRMNHLRVVKLQKRFFLFGWLFALAMSVFMYFAITFIYQLQFTFVQYFLAFSFMIPLLLHILIINEYYKKDKQKEIAIFTLILVIFQLILGYYLIKSWNINGALILKVIGQWCIVILLWLWIRKKYNNA